MVTLTKTLFSCVEKILSAGKSFSKSYLQYEGGQIVTFYY